MPRRKGEPDVDELVEHRFQTLSKNMNKGILVFSILTFVGIATLVIGVVLIRAD